MTDQELTPEVAAAFFGKPSEPTAAPTEAPEQPIVELDNDQTELARRYSLTAEDAKRIRGDTWAERCEDAERLVGLAGEQSIRDRARAHLRAMQEGNPNVGELAAFATVDAREALIGSLHPPSKDKGND